jgi:hypothetical protein
MPPEPEPGMTAQLRPVLDIHEDALGRTKDWLAGEADLGDAREARSRGFLAELGRASA